MGTRSLTFVYDGEKPIVNMYRQFDGYPSGHGVELSEFLTQMQVGNGISGSPELFSFANGMGCLAAQMIVWFKKTPGGFYIYPVEMNQDCWQDYEYHVYDNKVIVQNCNTVYDSGHKQVIFDGAWEEFGQFCLDPISAE